MNKALSGISRAFALTLLLVLAPGLRAEPVTIAALGDSLTQGYGLPQEDGLVPQLDAWLKAQGADAVLINAGVSGDTTAGGAARVDWTLTPDVDAMIVTLGANDLLRGLDPGQARTNLDAILTVGAERGVRMLLVGIPAPRNYGPDYKAAFDAIYPELASKHGTLLAPSFFEGFGTDDPAQARGVWQPDNIHPNAAGVALIVEALGPYVLDLIAEVRAEGS